MQLMNPGLPYQPQRENLINVATTTIAAFLIARGTSAVIVLPAYDRAMTRTPFSLARPPLPPPLPDSRLSE